ncbi:MAG: methylated-DNA--[protein]-cysteine S-methyltransferase, partial [Methylococcaceae bacterium]
MPFIIHWVDHCPGRADVVTVNTPAGKLILSISQGVIRDTDWAQNDSLLNQSCEFHWPEFSRYWLNPDSS